jgi:flagellar protein FlaG
MPVGSLTSQISSGISTPGGPGAAERPSRKLDARGSASAEAPAASALQASAQAAQASTQAEPSREELQAAIVKVSKEVELRAPQELTFSVDQDTGKTIVQITDAKTGELIRQIPPKEMVEIAKSIERMQGLLVSRQA